MNSLINLELRTNNLDALREKIAIEQGCQKYPHSKIKVGISLYKVDVAEWDDGSTSISIDEWLVRSIKRRRGTQTAMGKRRVGDAYGDTAPLYVNVTAKIKGVTWVKQSRMANDFGWSKSIPKGYREQFQVGARLPLGIFTTPLAALKWALKDNERELERYHDYRNKVTDEAEIAEWDEEINHKTKSVRMLKSRIKKFTSK
ncbi:MULTISPECIES: hypothetical protein [Vibrio]|uniref:hypothetical protein n=1 Tax=Vibrio TaxID=662 RepID=UPI00086B221D|nr:MULTISPECIES: hypothetical protein [Vibrio]ODM57009.1 hypothetical protein BC455_18115 [Vibrio harveyi]USD58649.1 hypothetical protein J4N44_27235 [Vibrio sp. SCSIO 43155]